MNNNPAYSQQPLDFLWLEVTNRCNLQCSHCYAESGPDTEVVNPLSRQEYERLMAEAFSLGCRKLQFIGGEPTLNKNLVGFIQTAARTGYQFIEVFTNLTRLSDELLSCFMEHRVHVATSVYAPSAEVHDHIARTEGSFAKTIRNIRKLSAAGIGVRVGITEMAENVHLTDATLRFLKDELHIEHVKLDRMRPFGRGGSGENDMHELCGKCAQGTLCIGPDGSVSPCIMSKRWGVGSVREASLADIISSQRLSGVRGEIYRSVIEPRIRARLGGIAQECVPETCTPVIGCPPYNEPTRLVNGQAMEQECVPETCTPVIGCPPYDQPSSMGTVPNFSAMDICMPYNCEPGADCEPYACAPIHVCVPLQEPVPSKTAIGLVQTL